MYEISEFDNDNSMTSPEIAEATGKQHQHVFRLRQGADASNFGLISYIDASNPGYSSK